MPRDVTMKLMTEMQILVSLACYDSLVIAQGDDAMTENTMAKTMTAVWFGGNNPKIISYLDHSINRLRRVAGLFTSSEPDKFGQIVLSVSPKNLHRHSGLNTFVGSASITN